MKKISVCTRYNTLGASSRLRFFMYREKLAENGIKAEFRPLLGDGYLKRLYTGRAVRFHAAAAMAKRFLTLPFLGRELLIEYELLPFIPLEAERFFLRNRKYILSFDDAVWEKYNGHSTLAGKFESLASGACGIISANDVLTGHLKEYNSNIIKIPTAIDLDRYTRVNSVRASRFTVAWIGTPVTYAECLMPFAGMLQKAAEKVDFELLVIAKKDLPGIPGVNMTFCDWSDETEALLLKRSHIGIMPLPENDFMRGKSAYKLIQYLGAGLPCIARPVGENRVLLSQGNVGFSAAAEEDWINALHRLSTDRELYDMLSTNALALAKEYSIQKYAPIMADFIKSCFAT